MKALLTGLAIVGGSSWACAAHATECSFQSLTGLAFGSYAFNGGPVETSGTIVYRCTGALESNSVTIQLDHGLTGTFDSLRNLTSGAFVLQYNLFRNAARTIVWGDGSGTSTQYGPEPVSNGVDVTLDVYGRIPGGQNAKPGVYGDTVTVTIAF